MGAFFLILPQLLPAQDADCSFQDGEIKVLCTYDGNGQIRQRITFHYALLDGENWYPVSDIAETFSAGSGIPAYSGVHYTYSEDRRPASVVSIAADGTRSELSYSYAPDGTLQAVSARKNGVLQYSVAFDGGTADLAQMRKLERWQLRRAVPDPVEERRRLVRSVALCEKNPFLTADPLEGGSFLFDADGSYLGRVRCEGHPNELVYLQTGSEDPQTAVFADPVEDPASLYVGSRFILPAEQEIVDCLRLSGSLEKGSHGFFKGCFFLYRKSGYGGTLDFAAREEYGIALDGLYITRTARDGSVAHNNFNYGNFLWAAAAHAVGVPLWIAKLGAHINNFFLSPDTRGSFDSPDDQFSIGCGHHYFGEHKVNN